MNEDREKIQKWVKTLKTFCDLLPMLQSGFNKQRLFQQILMYLCALAQKLFPFLQHSVFDTKIGPNCL